MSATSQRKREKEKDPKQQEDDKRSVLIGERVLQLLGEPKDMQQLQVRHLWELHYRVNVIVGPDFASSRVGHSFFLATNAEGDIVTSEPKIARQY